MPQGDGIAATREIRKNPNNAAPPILALTARTAENAVEHCHQAGMNDLIVKPFSRITLFRALEHWVCQPADIERSSSIRVDSPPFGWIKFLGKLSGITACAVKRDKD